MTTLRFTIGPDLWMSANDRMHWAPKAKRTKALRQLGYTVAMREPVGAFDTCHVAAFIGYTRNGTADPANAAPTVKALIDGLTDAGVWPDDDSVHVIGPTYLRDPKTGDGTYSVRLVLTEQEIPWLTDLKEPA
jgi:hypothetical protein